MGESVAGTSATAEALPSSQAASAPRGFQVEDTRNLEEIPTYEIEWMMESDKPPIVGLLLLLGVPFTLAFYALIIRWVLKLFHVIH